MKRKGLIFFASLLLTVALFGFSACSGTDGQTPYIGENGNWWVAGSDLGVAAQGEKGDQGLQGQPGAQGEKGEKGESVEVSSVQKTKTEGSIDTYTIYFSDATQTTFTVTNGSDGKSISITKVEKTATNGLVDTYKISFSDNSYHTFTVTNGEDGSCVTIKSIDKTATAGLVDTYTIEFSDGTKTTFTVTNGKDGETPFIGSNGNWWIGGTDTGVLADFSQDERLISDGLYFITMTVKGKVGMVVSQYYGSDKDVVIPNYVGSVPVIGVLNDAFEGNSTITSVSLSKNTVYLDDDVFESCSRLASIDFNGCQLSEIPTRAFKGTALTEIDLPETVTKLGAYAFDGIPFTELDYSNITYFGEYCLSGLVVDCVYLTEEVEYIGSYAFVSTYVYAEHEAAPASWGANIAGTSNLSGVVTYNCLKNENYIYSIENGEISVNFYIGNQKKIAIPSAIDGKPVKKIGYGFNSLTESGVEYLFDVGAIDEDVPSTWASLQVLEEVKIPSSVTKIEFGSFYCYGTMIFIPSSVNTMWGGVGCIDGDDFANSFLAFESTSYPTFKKGFLDSSESYTETNWISTYGSVIRTALGVDSSKVEYSDTEKSYYYKELEGYSLFAVMDLTSERLNINANFNKATVHTIRPNAVKGLFNVRTVKIGDGISKIQGKAFDNLSLTTVLIPKSVTTINAYGLDGVCSRFLIEASSQPSEWDSYWAGSNTSSCKITYSVDVENVLVYSDFIYEINGTKVTLVSYIGTSTTIRIPRTIEGKTVTKIKTGFASTQSSHTVYIPSTVITIESKAFTVTSTSSYAYFYFEAEALLTTYANDFFYNSYYGSTNYKYTYFNRSLGY